MGKPYESNRKTHQEIENSASDHLRRPPGANPCKVFHYFYSSTKQLNVPVKKSGDDLANLQQNGSDSSPGSNLDSKDYSESECSSSDRDEDNDVHQEEAIQWSQSRNTDSSGDNEVDGELEGRNNLGSTQNSEDIATVVREAISINSVSVHQNYGRAVTYNGLQGDKDLEGLREQGSTEDDISTVTAGPNITEAPSIPTTIESEVAAESGRSKRKRIVRKEVLDTLNGCLCGEVVDPSELPSNTIIKCKEIGCETEWVISNSFSMDWNSLF